MKTMAMKKEGTAAKAAAKPKAAPKASPKAAPKAKAAAKPKAAPKASPKAAPKAKAEGVPQKKPRSKEGAAEAKAAATMTTAEWKELQKGMNEKWPAPAYMENAKDRISKTCYLDETYEAITRWSAETKISYRPYAKAPGSKSHLRYNEYSQATTAAEALELGTFPADWCWDYERGFIKVEGPLRDEPLDTSKIMNDSELTPVDKEISRWYRRELAKNLGLDIKDLMVSKGGGESTLMRAHRLVAQREAKKRLETAEKEGRKITKHEVLKTMQEWAFAKNSNRQNVLPDERDWVWSDTLGLLRDRMGDIHLTKATEKYPEVTQLLNQYLLDNMPQDMKNFKWTSLNLNCNYAAKLHRDGNNFGPSCIIAVGNFTGGELNYWQEDDRKADKLEELKDEDKVSLDLKNGLAMFNGNCGHSVNDFKGDRYSIVYFTAGCHDKAPDDCKDKLTEIGMQYPASNEDRYALLRPPRGYGEKAAKSASSKLPPMRYMPDSELNEQRPVATPARGGQKRSATPKASGAKRVKKSA